VDEKLRGRREGQKAEEDRRQRAEDRLKSLVVRREGIKAEDKKLRG